MYSCTVLASMHLATGVVAVSRTIVKSLYGRHCSGDYVPYTYACLFPLSTIT